MVRRALERAPNRPDSDYDRLAQLSNVYQDRHWGPLVGLLFVLGGAACLAAGVRTGLFLLPAIVLLQLLLYVALDGPEIRYRTALQPLIAILSAGGLLLVVERVASTWQSWDRRSLRSLLLRDLDVVEHAAANGVSDSNSSLSLWQHHVVSANAFEDPSVLNGDRLRPDLADAKVHEVSGDQHGSLKFVANAHDGSRELRGPQLLK